MVCVCIVLRGWAGADLRASAGSATMFTLPTSEHPSASTRSRLER